ncbi:hypothetical protein GA0115244_103823 [Streptomyces sp. DvalAA-19]|nr:hypothetical protein GA0115244_103823 [Streptomyces sp. DvalAA-19]
MLCFTPLAVCRAGMSPALGCGTDGEGEAVERPLLPLRSALVFLMAVVSGMTAGCLCWIAGEGVARGVLAGLAVVGLSVPFFDRLIAREAAGDPCGEVHEHG